MSTQTVTIDGLNDKESIVSDPWSLLYQLMQSASQQLQWKTGKLFHSEGSELRSLLFICFLSQTVISAWLMLRAMHSVVS